MILRPSRFVAAMVVLSGCPAERGQAALRAGLAERAERARAAIAGAIAPPKQTPTPSEPDRPPPKTLAEQRDALLRRMERELALTPDRMTELRRIFEASKMLGQGNPEPTRYPMTRAECRAARAAAGEVDGGDPLCGVPHMVRVWNADGGETAESARLCIDQYEFPGLPCEYPVVYARANEVVDLCKAVGKRMCDAHEWEGACAGSLRPPDEEYAWGKKRPYATHLHNEARKKVWAYGATKDHARCATASRKSDGCVAGSWKKCGSNTYPTGAFPGCKSRFGVFDQHGNAAEHMNLPLTPEELAGRGGTGQTEMKGSWFVFKGTEAHEDDCRWRAKDWHPSRVADPESHRNYHLGFRCCRDL